MTKGILRGADKANLVLTDEGFVNRVEYIDKLRKEYSIYYRGELK